MGILLALYGLGGLGWDSAAGRLNAIWGAVMLIFGGLLSYYGLRGERRVRKPERVAGS